MTRRFTPVALLTGCVLLAASFAPAAEDYLKLVPDSALGIFVVNDPSALDTKLQSFGRQMQLPVPSLLAMLDRFGIRKGFDEKRAVAVVVLPSEMEGMPPAPIIFVPVTNSLAFLDSFESVKKLPDEPVYEVSGFNTQFYVRVQNIGGYAAVTDQIHREILFEKNLKISKEVPANLTRWRQWLAGHDAAGVILPPGIKFISSKVQKGLQEMQSSLGNNERMKSMAGKFDLYGKVFQPAEREVAGWGFGLKVCKQNMLSVTSCTLLVPGGTWANFVAQVQPAKENLLAGLPDGPFTVAAGVAYSDEMMDALMRFSMDLMRNMREQYGLSKEQLDKISELSREFTKGIRAKSMMMQAGRSDDSFYSNMVCVMRVDDSREYIERYELYAKRYSEFLRGVDSPMLRPMEVEKSEVGGVAALQLTINVPQRFVDMPSPQKEKMMYLLYGPEKKIVSWFVPADKHSVVRGYVNKELLQRTIEAVKQGKPGLAGRSELKKTAALLPSDAVAVGYLSPSGMIDFLIKRIMSTTTPPGAVMPFPEFPQTPAIGFAVTTAPNEVQTHLVVPGEVIQAGIAGWQKAMTKYRRSLRDEFAP